MRHIFLKTSTRRTLNFFYLRKPLREEKKRCTSFLCDKNTLLNVLDQILDKLTYHFKIIMCILFMKHMQFKMQIGFLLLQNSKLLQALLKADDRINDSWRNLKYLHSIASQKIVIISKYLVDECVNAYATQTRKGDLNQVT